MKYDGLYMNFKCSVVDYADYLSYELYTQL